MTFRVGMKVICVNAGTIRPGEDFWFDDDSPTEGAIYTVAEIFVDFFGDTVMNFNELRRSENANRRFGFKTGYNVIRFRPIVERKTDISIFTKMLTGKGVRIDA